MFNMKSLSQTFAEILERESCLPQVIKQNVTRLRVWAENIHDHSLRKLESRLRFAPNLLETVRDLLTDFGELVEACKWSDGWAGWRRAQRSTAHVTD